MEFGYFAQAFVPEFEMEAEPGAEHRRLMENLEFAVECDRQGVKYIWCPEHHFLYEYSHMPAPEVFLSFVGARTSRIHLGTAITNTTPPVNHPARIAERAAMLDQLSEGRFEFGTGRGSSTTEVLGFGIPDLDITKDMWDETIREFPKMWKQQSYSFEGKYFSMPPRNVLPKPYTQPHPPMWVACGSPATFEKAGSLGLGAFCFTTGAPDTLEPLIKAYKDAVANATPVGDYVNDNILCVSTFLCMEDRDEAFRVASNMHMSYYSSLVFHWLDNIQRPAHVPEWPAKIPEPPPEFLPALVESGAVCVGDPDDVASVIQKYEDIGCDQVVFSPLSTTMGYERAVSSLQLFAKEVQPRFDKDPVHRTTRMREAAASV
ncbi:MAG TPA: LLM class flavin-dependent oxidoreductase [Acidimicrobiales bacterium]|nr:LLM class flavin-dependent oxidoreductase [Acidimicrobiales bacterium]